MKRLLAILILVATAAQGGQQIISRPWLVRYPGSAADPYWTGPYDSIASAWYPIDQNDMGWTSIVNANAHPSRNLIPTTSFRSDPTNAYELNYGASSYAYCRATSNLYFTGANDLTICCWMFPNAGNRIKAVSLSSQTNWAWVLAYSLGQANRFEINPAILTNTTATSPTYTPTDAPTETWTHVTGVLTWHSDTTNYTRSLYTNGIFSTQATTAAGSSYWVTNNNFTNNMAVYFGASFAGGLFQTSTGSINGARVYTRALSSGEIFTIASESRTSKTTTVTLGLELFFDLSTPSPTNVFDHSLLGLDGIRMPDGSGPYYQVQQTNTLGDIKYGLYFDGADDRVEFLANTNVTPSTGLTVMALFTPASAGTFGILSHRNTLTQRDWMFYLSSGAPAMIVAGPTNAWMQRYSATTIVANRPTFMAMRWNCAGNTNGMELWTNNAANTGIVRSDSAGATSGTWDSVNSNSLPLFMGCLQTNTALNSPFAGSISYAEVLPNIADTNTIVQYMTNWFSGMQKVQQF